jgi:hypothetical protein
MAEPSAGRAGVPDFLPDLGSDLNNSRHTGDSYLTEYLQ